MVAIRQVTKVTLRHQVQEQSRLLGLAHSQPQFFVREVFLLAAEFHSPGGFSAEGPSVDSPAGAPPAFSGELSASGALASLGWYCTMIEMRRLEASSGSNEVRKRWSANPRTCEIRSEPKPEICINLRAALARSVESSQLL